MKSQILTKIDKGKSWWFHCFYFKFAGKKHLLWGKETAIATEHLFAAFMREQK